MDRPCTVTMHNGEKVKGPFSDREMKQRLTKLREHVMTTENIDACLFTSIHNIAYYSGFVYCGFSRRYGLVVTPEKSTTISSGVDYGQPYRRTFGENITYTDWKKDNFFTTAKDLLKGVKRIGIELDHITVANRAMLGEAFPDATFVDVSNSCMRMRMVKSAEEIELIAKSAAISEVGAAAAVSVMKEGVPEYQVALASTDAMVKEIIKVHPNAELRDTWTWFQSGINTDGAHNAVTKRELQKGDILSLNCFPMVYGYYAALERTMFLDHVPSKRAMEIWQINIEVQKRGIELLKPGVRLCDIANELSEIYKKHNLFQYRTIGYGHAIGALCHYYGREAGLEIREDIETVLEPGMVISMEPMVTIPEGEEGAGGYREHDILVITETGNRNLTKFPIGPEKNIIKN